MSRWFWVRHGPTHERAVCGHRDVPADLSDAAALSRLSAHLPEDALVVASDLQRASATADAISGGRHRLRDRPALREFDFGVWDGMAFDAIASRDPRLSREYWESPGDVAPEGGESWNAAAARVEAEVTAILAAHPGRDVVAVAHFGVILTRVAQARRVSPAEALAQRIDPLSVTELHLGPDGWHEAAANLRP